MRGQMQTLTTGSTHGVQAEYYQGAKSQPSSPISDALSAQEKVLAELAQSIVSLEIRLSSIARPVPPSTGADQAGTPQPVRSPVAGELEHNNARIVTCIAHIGQILHRLDV